MAPKANLADFGLRSFVSQSGLSSVLKQIREHGLPSSNSRQSIKRARERAVRVNTSHGALFQKVSIPISEPNAAPLLIECINPAAMLAHAVSSCDGFGEYFFKLLSEKPCTCDAPWGLAVYADEVAPGNQLKHENKRKVYAVYWSFNQFGSGLSHEALWMVLAITRSSHVAKIGGLGVLMKHLLHLFFEGSDFRHGISLHRDGVVKMVFATLQTVVADEAALKSIWDVKGSSGTLPCFLCKNVIMHRSGLHTQDVTGILVSSADTDTSKFHLHTNESIISILRMLQTKKDVLSATAFAKLEQSVGLNLRPQGVLMCSRLQGIALPVSTTQFDWMHIFVVNGIWNLECGLLIAEINKHGVRPSELHQFFDTLVWPSSISSKSASGSTAFHKRASNDDPLKCSASEGIGLYSPLRSFLQSKFRPDKGSNLDLVLQSYYSLANVLDLLKLTPQGRVEPSSLHRAVVRHLSFFKMAYSPERMLPKHHMALHLATQLARHGQLITCWVHERKHKEVKRFANHLCNTSHMWESSVLEAMMRTHCNLLADPQEMPTQCVQLVDPKPAPFEMAKLIQSAMRSQGQVFSSKVALGVTSTKYFVNDCVIFDSDEHGKLVGQVWFHASVDDVCITCVSQWQSIGNNCFNVSENPVLIPTAAVHDACIYHLKESIATIVPFTHFSNLGSP